MASIDFIPIREIPHSKYYKILLLAVGLWPYQRSKFVLFQTILFSTVLSTTVLFQLAPFLTSTYTTDLIINAFISTFISISITSMYNTFWMNINITRYFLDEIRHIYNELKDEKEIIIMDKYARKSRLFAILSILFAFGVSLVAIFYQFGSVILNLDESRLRRLPISTEYFIDQEKKYFYVFLLYVNLNLCITVIAVLSIIITLRTFILYICGMFRIVSYRIEQAIAINMLQNKNPAVEYTISKRIGYAVDIHNKSMMFCNLLTSSFEKICFFLIIIAIALLSLSSYAIVKTIRSGNKIEESIWHLVILCIIIISVFISNYAGQEVIEYNNNVYVTAYNIEWYKASVRIQRLILFLLLRGNKYFRLQFVIFEGSLENFAMMMSAYCSYFAVLNNIQQF